MFHTTIAIAIYFILMKISKYLQTKCTLQHIDDYFKSEDYYLLDGDSYYGVMI